MAEQPALQVELEVEGVVRVYHTNRHPSFGFVTPTDGSVTGEVLVGNKCVKKAGLKSLQQGTGVKCFCIRKEKGLRAKRIEVLS